MNKLVVGIPTYKRPKMLEKLILSIYASQLNANLIGTIDIVVVDNDKERTAASIINELKKKCIQPFAIHYFNFPKKGLTHVRNEIIKQSLSFDPDYIAFVDDDEYVTENWLNELVKTMIDMNADIVLGPNLPVFENEVPEYLARWFHVGRIYRAASTFTYILKLRKSYTMLIRKFFISIFYLVLGICSLVFLPFSGKHKYLGLIKISEALGGFAGMMNIRYKEYASSN